MLPPPFPVYICACLFTFCFESLSPPSFSLTHKCMPTQMHAQTHTHKDRFFLNLPEIFLFLPHAQIKPSLSKTCLPVYFPSLSLFLASLILSSLYHTQTHFHTHTHTHRQKLLHLKLVCTSLSLFLSVSLSL
jgi:hypothetical protein